MTDADVGIAADHTDEKLGSNSVNQPRPRRGASGGLGEDAERGGRPAGRRSIEVAHVQFLLEKHNSSTEEPDPGPARQDDAQINWQPVRSKSWNVPEKTAMRTRSRRVLEVELLRRLVVAEQLGVAPQEMIARIVSARSSDMWSSRWRELCHASPTPKLARSFTHLPGRRAFSGAVPSSDRIRHLGLIHSPRAFSDSTNPWPGRSGA